MRQLAPIDSYREGISSIPALRLGLAAGFFFAVLSLLVLFAATTVFVPDNLRQLLPWGALMGAVLLAGAFFGLVFPRFLKKRLLKAMEAVYLGMGSYATHAPDGPYEYSFPCSLLRGRLEVGGVLYLGRRIATFVPHSMNLSQHREPVAIAHGNECTVLAVDRQRSLGTLLIGQAPQLIEIVSPRGSWRLNAPQASRWIPQLQGLLGAD